MITQWSTPEKRSVYVSGGLWALSALEESWARRILSDAPPSRLPIPSSLRRRMVGLAACLVRRGFQVTGWGWSCDIDHVAVDPARWPIVHIFAAIEAVNGAVDTFGLLSELAAWGVSLDDTDEPWLLALGAWAGA